MMRRTRVKTTLLGMLTLTVGLLAGCGWTPDLEVRTFELQHLRPYEAVSLIEPYVYGDRPEAPGTVSSIEGAITVRETPDNLDQISRVLAEFDLPHPDTRLHFQLIEADGFTASDPKIADVEAELRKIFQFGGYRLAGEAFVSATEATEIQQGLRAGDGGMYEIRGTVHRLSPGAIRLENVTLHSYQTGMELQTTVTVRPGQTLVLGSSPKTGSSATLLLTVRAEEGPGPD